MYLWIICLEGRTIQKQCNFSLFHRKSCCDSLTRESRNVLYATMGVWERMPLRSRFAFSFSSQTPALAGVHTPHERVSPHIRAGGSRPPCGNIALYGHYTMRSKGHGADCGKTLYRRLTVPNYAPEKGKGHPPVIEAEAVAAMTCTGAIPLKTAHCVPGRNDRPHIRV